MGNVTELIRNLVIFLKRNLFRIALIPVIAIAWIPFLFPYSDLRAVIATTLSTAMGDGVAIDFDHISIVPGFPVALDLKNIEVNGPGLPPLTADHLIARPSLVSLFTRQPAGSVEADGIFKGNITASLASGAKTKTSQRQDIKTNMSGVQLAALSDTLRRAGLIGFNIQGSLDTQGSLSVDPNFEEQPDADLFIQGKSISIPSVSVPIPNMGPIQTPSLQLGQMEFKGKMNEGKIQIENFSFGQGKDALTGRVRGELGLAIRKEDQRVRANPGAFDLKVELNISKSLMDAMSKSGVALALLLVEKYKTTSGDTSKYAFRVRASAFGVTPTFEPIGSGT